MPDNPFQDDEPCYVISVVAKLVELHPQTLRYYDKIGLLRPSRTHGRTRLYSMRDVEELRKITRLTICGMQSDFCVDTTTRWAMALGYPVVLVSDAHTTEANAHLSARQIIQHHNDTLPRMESFGARTRTVPANQVSFLD